MRCMIDFGKVCQTPPRFRRNDTVYFEHLSSPNPYFCRPHLGPDESGARSARVPCGLYLSHFCFDVDVMGVLYAFEVTVLILFQV